MNYTPSTVSPSNQPIEAMNQFMGSIPYAEYLSLAFNSHGDELTLVMPVAPHLVGNSVIPALHGGVVGAFLETTALMQIVWASQKYELSRTIDVTVNFFRMAQVDQISYARAKIIRQGRRTAHVHAEAWQQNHHKPIAALHGNFLLPE